MKIRSVTAENLNKVLALLKNSFPENGYESRLTQNLHGNNRSLNEWVCIHTNRVIAYVCFSKAYREKEVCGLHLATLAVHPDFQNQGIGSELLSFALKREEIREKSIYVLGDSKFYSRFGFEPCEQPLCPFDKGNKHFFALRNEKQDKFKIGYEPEFFRK